jgi:hypothetical protein
MGKNQIFCRVDWSLTVDMSWHTGNMILDQYRFENLNLFLFPFLLNVEVQWLKCLHINYLDSISGGVSYVNFHQQIEITSRPHSASDKKLTIGCYFSSSNRLALWTLLWYVFIAPLYPLLWNRPSSLACIISSNIPLPLLSVFKPFFKQNHKLNS